MLFIPSEGSGCADGSSEGLEHHGKVAACEGEWAGHVQNSSYLCARGWRVCGWYDEHVLKTITWKDAMSVEGCFAFNAAQDGGECKECRSFLEEVRTSLEHNCEICCYYTNMTSLWGCQHNCLPQVSNPTGMSYLFYYTKQPPPPPLTPGHPKSMTS